jgi:hypothetical protein
LTGAPETLSKNDFLGDVTSSSFDTHRFHGRRYEGALIQKGDELHLHLRSPSDSQLILATEDVVSLANHVNQSVGFCLGFNPWPAYREIRVDHVVVERWIRPRVNLPSTYFVPISEQMWSTFRSDKDSPMHSIIPCIADGLSDLTEARRDKLSTLLWHLRAISFSELPKSFRLLTVCAALDAVTKLVADVKVSEKLATDKTWKKASEVLGISWDGWTNDVFTLWGKYRHTLSHGWLWLGEAIDPRVYFADYPKLGCSFTLMVACLCGYRGPILTDPFQGTIINIPDIMDPSHAHPN